MPIDTAKLEKALDTLVGPRDQFRKELLDAPEILSRMCRCAAREAKRWRREPWVIIADWTAYGSGMSRAIYELYKPAPVAGEKGDGDAKE